MLALAPGALAVAASRFGIPRAQPLVSSESILCAMIPGATETAARRGRLLSRLRARLARARASLLASRRRARRLSLARRFSSSVWGQRLVARRAYLAYRGVRLVARDRASGLDGLSPPVPLVCPPGPAAPYSLPSAHFGVPAWYFTPQLSASLQAVMDLAYAPYAYDVAACVPGPA